MTIREALGSLFVPICLIAALLLLYFEEVFHLFG